MGSAWRCARTACCTTCWATIPRFAQDYSLGSTALTAYDDGVRGAELRYRAWGETRYAWEGTPTTYRFTGQREDATIQLLFYNARYYDGALGRFIQADTVVPNPADPQALNRYSYARNNALRYIDPSGHIACEDAPWECDDEGNWLKDPTPQLDPVTNMFDTGYDYGQVNTQGTTDDDDLLHPGIDVNGTPNANGDVVIVAPASGQLYFFTDANGFGNYAILKVSDGQGGFYHLIFAHMRDNNTYRLRDGQRVSIGTSIGIVGTTGNSTGNHLHYEVRHDPDMQLTATGFSSNNPDLQGRQLYYPRREILEQGRLFINPWRFKYIHIPAQPMEVARSELVVDQSAQPW